jgi:Tfp pilus assembly protein PilF
VWAELGHCLALQNQWKEAAIALQKALDLNVEDEELLIHRARAYRENGDPDLAQSILEFLLSRDPKSYLALGWSAKFAEEDGKPRLADTYRSRMPGHKPKSLQWPELAVLDSNSP